MLFFVIVCLPVADFQAIFDLYLSILLRFIYLHIVKSTPYNQSCNVLYFDVHVTFYVIMSFHLVALK